MSPVPIPARISGLMLPPFDPSNNRAAELRRLGYDVISLGQAVPDFGPPQCAVDAVRRALESPAAHRYATDPGLPSLREALSERLRLHGIDVAQEEIVITAGGNHAFALAAVTLISPGDEVLLPSPYFTNHAMMLSALGADAKEVPLREENGFRLRWSDLAPHVTGRTRAVVFCTPSNPTGAVIEPQDGDRIVGELATRNVLVISDETYMRFVYEGRHWSAASVPGWRENVVVIGTFSKSFGMPGWRVGYFIAAPAVCAEAVKVQDAMIICAPVLSQIGAEAAVREAWDYPLRFRAELEARRTTMQQELSAHPNIRWTVTGGGFFAFVRVEGCRDAAGLSTRLLEQYHVVALPGSTFGRAGEGYLRLSYGAATQAQLREAVARLGRACAGVH